MNDEINEEQKTSEEQEVKSDALADDVLDDASGGAAYIKFASIEGEVLDESHKEWDDVISIGTPINEPTTREVSDDDLEIKR
jgi:transcriptional regulator NrdR family protein